MSISRDKLLGPVLAAAALVLLTFGTPGTARAALTIELTAVVTDAAGVVQPTGSLQIGPVVSVGAFPTFVTINTPPGSNIGDLLLLPGAAGGIGARHTASDPNTIVNNQPGSLLQSLLDQLTNTAAGTAGVVNRIATVVVSATGFTAPPDGKLGSLNLAGQWAGALGSSIVANWYVNGTNALATVTGTPGSMNKAVNLNGSTQVGVTAGPGNTPGSFFTATSNGLQAFSNTQENIPLPVGAPYGMSLVFTINLTPGANLQSRGQALLALPSGAAVPEPSTVAMAFSGLPLLGGLWLRRRRRS